MIAFFKNSNIYSEHRHLLLFHELQKSLMVNMVFVFLRTMLFYCFQMQLKQCPKNKLNYLINTHRFQVDCLLINLFITPRAKHQQKKLWPKICEVSSRKISNKKLMEGSL